MSWVRVGLLGSEEVIVDRSGNTVQILLGGVPEEVRIVLPTPLAVRVHAALSEALNSEPEEQP